MIGESVCASDVARVRSHLRIIERRLIEAERQFRKVVREGSEKLERMLENLWRGAA